MDYPQPIGRNEKLRRKWWKFLVANGYVTPAVKIERKVSTREAKALKAKSACNGEGTQFEYDSRTGIICGFFRDRTLYGSWLHHKCRWPIWQFDSLLLRGERKGAMFLMDKSRKEFRIKYRTEIRSNYQFWRILKREMRILVKLENEIRESEDRGQIEFLFLLQIGRVWCYPIEKARAYAKSDLDLIYYLQITKLQKLISKKQHHKTS